MSGTRRKARLARLLLTLAPLAAAALACSPERLPVGPGGEDRAPVLVAFLSERPPSQPFGSDIYLCDLSRGGPARIAPDLNTPSIEGPCALSGDGRKIAFYTNRLLIGSFALILLYDFDRGELTVPQALNQLTTLQNPALSGDGRYLAAQYQVAGPFDLYIAVEDLAADTLLPLPNLNAAGVSTIDPSLSGDGGLIALSSNRFGTEGAFDVFLYSVAADSFLPLPGLNSPQQELSPSISADGRYIAFQSGRIDNEGIIDVFVYDRQTQSLLPLPGANTEVADFQPAISPDGRYLAYATEAEGGRDVRIYDIQAQRLLSTPKLNDPYFFDYFPALASTGTR